MQPPLNTELSICTMDGSYDGKTPNVASSPWRLSGPLRVVALGGPTEDKFDACAHEWNCYLTVAESIHRQIESSPMFYRLLLVLPKFKFVKDLIKIEDVISCNTETTQGLLVVIYDCISDATHRQWSFQFLGPFSWIKTRGGLEPCHGI